MGSEALSDVLRFEVRGFGIDAIVVEPGPIRSQFGATAVAGIAAAPESPYAKFNAALAEQIRAAFDGPMGQLAGSPEAVAETILRAITASRPKPRYKVTAAARMLMGVRRILPDRAFDAFLRTMLPTPGA
jgi:NAD(P)-dependent dehydrogenase (short-subunit alcohol dehydrogenase family)